MALDLRLFIGHTQPTLLAFKTYETEVATFAERMNRPHILLGFCTYNTPLHRKIACREGMVDIKLVASTTDDGL